MISDRTAVSLLAVLLLGVAAATIASPTQVEYGRIYDGRADENRSEWGHYKGQDRTSVERNNSTTVAAESTLTRTDASSGSSERLPYELLGVGALLALGSVVTFLYVTRGDDVGIEYDEPIEDEEDPEPTDEDSSTAAVGRIAGRTADRLDDADTDNEIYRAWHEMTEHLDVSNPESSTPGEFAEAAVEAGMDPEDVSRLTSLFERVRYGSADPTSERVREARATLRHIESTYANGGNE